MDKTPHPADQVENIHATPTTRNYRQEFISKVTQIFHEITIPDTLENGITNEIRSPEEALWLICHGARADWGDAKKRNIKCNTK